MQHIRLKKINGGKNVRLIAYAAFQNCEALQDIGELGESTEVIFSYAFYNCKKLESFSFCNELKTIAEGAFGGTGLEEVKLPEKEIFFGGKVFNETPWMERQGEEFVVLNNVLIRYQGNEEVVHIPEGIRGVALDFVENEKVKEVYIPDTAEYVTEDTCKDSCVEKIYIPKEVTRIGVYKDCSYDYEGGDGQQRILEYSIRETEETGRLGDKDRLIIVTTAGSPAEAYAKEYGYQCEIVEGW